MISPLLSPADRAAIEDGAKSANDVAAEIMEQVLLTVDLIQQHTLQCLTQLLHSGRLEIKIALMKDALFHPKVWLFRAGRDLLAAHGSSNITYSGVRKNVEQVAISKSWEDQNQRFTTDALSDEFARLWENRQEHCIVVGAPETIREGLVHTYGSGAAPTEDDLRELYKRAKDAVEPAAPLRT